MTTKIERLSALLGEHFGERAKSIVIDRGEVTLEVAADDYRSAAIELRDRAEFAFEQLVDVSGLDYSAWANREWTRERYAASTHLLSIANNWRLRLRAFAPDDGFPVLDSLCDVWPSANWFEREVFDLFGIMFSGHPDLRRILTDYGFVGHPFRKDFPVSGYVEMRYDPEQRRVVYQPVTIEPRENTPRVVREANYGDVGHG
ncbi:NADH-quinone oxidoreductase subunit C [Denitromonas ohlonensis]|uniref:NADH-quinone oxidoreductase subunit C n=2 Tax=Denitromonas TaxID=139331 RepID=A0A558EP58_9RHOO|nr:NADH-quinone oxidoreductase subunit C [Denitromonas ohlonensis]TVO69316.1 NADH-quinone oxidoreductase subunit C [Denitromonas ohlonensis]TVO77416.1 NADH-quinone oxidoreductase subunit C [Denitromonas ohlonensis]TVT50187.1 MAG: NADH-quinone oxidoreductase subunit C [Denitromonas halophila]TVT74858.1 MAG: NADH-quinone oxidoreductase subunit C [Denitromonas halophila]